METKLGRPRGNREPPKNVHIKMTRELHAQMKAQADAEAMELAAWIRRTCMMELKRRQRKAAA